MNRDREWLFHIQNPQVWTGLEINACHKPLQADRRGNVCLVFPDTYEIGMSHHGTRILYHALNRLEGVTADRSCLPDPDSLKLFQMQQTVLQSLEHHLPLRSFGIVAVSLMSELLFTNLLLTLDLAGIPLQSHERGEGDPLILAGGISCSNPEPIRAFADVIAIGDGELLFPQIMERLLSLPPHAPRTEKLERLASLPGVYIPSRVPLRKKGPFLVPDLPPGSIRKQVLRHMEESFPSPEPLVPIGNAVFHRLDVEIARGCPQGCRFCQARAYYGPFRPKNPEQLTTFIRQALASSGFDTVSLSSLSSGDFPHLNPFLNDLLPALPPCTSVAVSSLRPSTLGPELLDALGHSKKSGLTLVPEAGREAMRRRLNKQVTDEDLMSAVDLALDRGWQRVKLYFMIGLPEETPDDLEGAAQVIEAILGRARSKGLPLAVHASFSPFVPKPHTPLERAERVSTEWLLERMSWLRERLRRYRQVRLDFHRPQTGLLETILSRGDARVGELLLAAHQAGQHYTAWNNHWNDSAWNTLLETFPHEMYLQAIPPEQALPWAPIGLFLKQESLAQEARKAEQEESSPACSPERCPECHACQSPMTPLPGPQVAPQILQKTDTAPIMEADWECIRLHYRKTGDFAFFSHLAMAQYLEHLIRITGLPFRTRGSFHPHMLLRLLPPLPVYAQSWHEIAEFMVPRTVPVEAWAHAFSRIRHPLTWTHFEKPAGRPKLSVDIGRMTMRYLHPSIRSREDELRQILEPGDRLFRGDDHLDIDFHFGPQAEARLAALYRVVDPDKTGTRFLHRLEVSIGKEPEQP